MSAAVVEPTQQKVLQDNPEDRVQETGSEDKIVELADKMENVGLSDSDPEKIIKHPLQVTEKFFILNLCLCLHSSVFFIMFVISECLDSLVLQE